MTLDEAIKRYTSNAFYEKSDGNLQGHLEFNQLAEWLKDYKRLLEQEPCDDVISREEVLRELKGCLTGGETEYQYVKLHIDSIPPINLQEPHKDTVSREDANKLLDIISFLMEIIKDLLPVKSQEPKTGHWITTREFMHDGEFYGDKCKCDAPNNEKWNYCPNCGAEMKEGET